MSSYQYRKSHCGDKTVVRSSYLHNGISYTGKMTSLYSFSPLVLLLRPLCQYKQVVLPPINHQSGHWEASWSRAHNSYNMQCNHPVSADTGADSREQNTPLLCHTWVAYDLWTSSSKSCTEVLSKILFHELIASGLQAEEFALRP